MSPNAIAKQNSSTARPSTLPQETQARISLTFNRVVPVGPRGEIAAADAPTANERTAWVSRLNDLRVSMEHADRNTVRTMVGSLLAGYPSGRGHKDEPEAVMMMFVQALAGIPAWAISSACSAWNRGEVAGKNSSFAPSPAELREAAMTFTTGFNREILMIGKIVNAEVIEERESDEVRERVAARVRQWLESRKAEEEDLRWGDKKTVDPINPRDAYPEWEKQKKAEIEADSKAGKYRLSPAALATFDKSYLDRVAVDDPASQFDAWNSKGEAA